MKSVSKFSEILAAKREPVATEESEAPTKVAATFALAESESPRTRSKPREQDTNGRESALTPRSADAPGSGNRGRPKAKRSDPDYVQTSPYIKKTTLSAVKMALLQAGQGKEYSELVEELLKEWLKTQIPESPGI